MSISPHRAWQIERSIKSHFTQKSYDFFKFKGKLKNSSVDIFDKSPEAVFFKQIVGKNKYSSMENLMGLFISSLALSEGNHKILWGNYWVSSEADEIFDKWNSGIEKFDYIILQETKRIIHILHEEDMQFKSLFVVEDGQHPLLLKLFYANIISLETLIVYNQIFHNFMKMWDKEIKETFMYKNTYFNALKYKPFLMSRVKIGEKLKEKVINEFKGS